MSEATQPRNGNGSELGDPRVKWTQVQVSALLLTRGDASSSGWSQRNNPPFETQNEAVLNTEGYHHGDSLPPCKGGYSSVTLEPGK